MNQEQTLAEETPEQALDRLGLTLPPVAEAVGAYLPWTQVGSVIYTSGQLPWIGGDLKYVGKLGRELTVEDGYQAYRLSALNAIAQLKSAVGEHIEKHRILSGCTGDSHPEEGFVLRHVQYFGTVAEERRSVTRIESSPVHLGEMVDELGFDATRIIQKLRQTAEKFIIRNRFEFGFVFHEPTISPLFSTG